MKESYNKSINLQCVTCGSECSFEKDDQTGIITCSKCNRVYYGGREELINLNRKRIDDEVQEAVDEVRNDFINEINNIFRKTGLKIK